MDLLQVNAFKSILRQNLRIGYSLEESFADAVASTSDTVFKKADPELIKEYIGTYIKTVHRVKNQPVYASSRSRN